MRAWVCFWELWQSIPEGNGWALMRAVATSAQASTQRPNHQEDIKKPMWASISCGGVRKGERVSYISWFVGATLFQCVIDPGLQVELIIWKARKILHKSKLVVMHCGGGVQKTASKGLTLRLEQKNHHVRGSDPKTHCVWWVQVCFPHCLCTDTPPTVRLLKNQKKHFKIIICELRNKIYKIKWHLFIYI